FDQLPIIQTPSNFTGVSENLPTVFRLQQNYPNPFNPTTTISYDVPVESYVKLTIYNELGQEITTVHEGVRSQGRYTTKFEANGLASGVYFYRLQAGGFVETRRMILAK
ncbi:MAG: T9SS type A sorting domain-containing protein, partial [Bacteroidota bacterium]